MFNRLGNTENKNLRVFIETILFFILFIVFAYFFHKDDILYLKTNLVFPIVFLAIVTLFYGLKSGIISLGLFFIVMYFQYKNFYIEPLLEEFVLVLIFGEFNYQWNKKLNHLKITNNDLKDRLEEIGESFYALKVSHDQLELNYILKPFSIRKSLQDITDTIDNDNDENNAWLNLQALLEKNFSIKKLKLCKVTNKKCEMVGGDLKSVSFNDPLLVNAFEKKLPVYISHYTELKSKYLAVIPGVYKNKIVAMLLIEDMPFMAFNQDNLTAISFIFDFFILSIQNNLFIKSYSILDKFDNSFRISYIKQYLISKKYQIDSSVIIFKTKSELSSHCLNEQIEDMIRKMDQFTTKKINDNFITIILLSFTGKESAKGFKNRILSNLEDELKNKLKYSIFYISQYKLMIEYIGIDR